MTGDGTTLPSGSLGKLWSRWLSVWESALAAWSRFTKLTEPRWCFRPEQEKAEGLTDSFAMIRLDDHAVVISLRKIENLGLQAFPREILAHEIGHHVYAPGDLDDNARLMARIRAALQDQGSHAGLVSNLYTDLLINDRLQRRAGLDMAGVFKKLRSGDATGLWAFYLRTYEILWSLSRKTLVDETGGDLDRDAELAARVVRVFAKDWLRGASRFAMLCLPYLLQLSNQTGGRRITIWLDATKAGASDVLPDGLSELELSEVEVILHPADDPRLSGLEEDEPSEEDEPGQVTGAETVGGRKNQYRDPASYVELMESLGVKVSKKEMVMRYYRERALPYLIPFPTKRMPQASDPLPESLDVWDSGSPLSAVDWTESLIRSPIVVPGVTTVERLYGTSPGGEPELLPLDLYLGIDCSGSMTNPAVGFSEPVLAGTVVALSAFRAGARVMATLSGEPGKHASTPGFVRSPSEVLALLTGYLGTGYAFGILRLKEAFLEGEPPKRATHILIVSDSDLFYMLKEVKNGWEIAADAAAVAGGGATAVLEIASGYGDEMSRLRSLGWDVHTVTQASDLPAFARAFSRARYGRED